MISPVSISAIFDTMRFMNSRSCEVMRRAPGYDFRNCSSQIIDSMSRWLVGSSISSTSGRPSSTRASATRIFQPPDAGNGLIEHRAALHLLHILTKVPDRELFRDRNLALVGRLLANDHAEQRGLASAVGTDQPYLLARVQLKGSVDENHLPAIL